MKKTDAVKTGISIIGSIKNKRDHNRFNENIANAQRIATFSNFKAIEANRYAMNLQGNLNRAWQFINLNYQNIHKIFDAHNSLAMKNNRLSNKLEEQQNEIDKLKQEIKKIKGGL